MTLSGFIIARLTSFAELDESKSHKITIDNHQTNGLHCIHQARVRLAGDPTTYRMILAPADAPVFINQDKRPVADAFAQPLGVS